VPGADRADCGVVSGLCLSLCLGLSANPGRPESPQGCAVTHRVHLSEGGRAGAQGRCLPSCCKGCLRRAQAYRISVENERFAVAAAPGLLSVGTPCLPIPLPPELSRTAAKLPEILPPCSRPGHARRCASAPWKSSPMCMPWPWTRQLLVHRGRAPDTEDMTEPSVQDLLERAALPAWWHRRNRAGLLRHGRPQGRPHDCRSGMAARAFAPSAPPRPAKAAGHPHPRASSDDTLAILRKRAKMAQPPRPAACSTASPKAWKSPSRAGHGLLHLVLGHLTFKNAQDLRDGRLHPAGPHADRNRQSLSGPRALPGQDQQPILCALCGAADGQLRGISAEEVGRITSANFDRLFAGVVA
jgi:TatD DNase family protein